MVIFTKKRSWRVLLLLFLILSGCAYYNTFYNAKQEFKVAEKERELRLDLQEGQRERPSSKENQAYTKAIEKASTVLEMFPDSKYVDDALLMLGKCFHYQQQYAKAERKFEEVLSLYGDGELADEALLWRAKSRKEQKKYEAAIADCQDLLGSNEDDELLLETQFLMGEILFARKDYLLAVEEYDKTLRATKDKDIRYDVFTRKGECYLELKKYALAAETFTAASKSSMTPQKRYRALLEMGTAMKLNGDHEEAAKTLNKLLTEQGAKDYWPDVEYQIAESIYIQGDIDNAVKWYKAITEEYPKAEATANAYYELGRIYESHFLDFKKAKENYDQVKKAAPRAVIVQKANSKSADIGKMLQLRMVIEEIEKSIAQADSAAADEAPAIKEVEVDTSAQTADPLAPVQQKKLDLAKTKAELGAAHLQLAELYFFQFSQPDSALDQYYAAYEMYPEGDVGPQALYSIAYIIQNIHNDTLGADTLLYVLIETFPESDQADAARRKLSLAARPKPEDTYIAALHEAERALWDEQNYRLAMQLYEDISSDTASGEYGAKAMYGRGWILEHKLLDNQGAYETYAQLAAAFPQSIFAKEIQNKISTVKQKAAADSIAAAAADTTTAAALDTTNAAILDTTNAAILDSTGVIKSDSTAAAQADSLKTKKIK